MFPVHADLLKEIVDDFLLIAIDPTCCKENDKSQIVRHIVEYT